jgi:hypothetical protein
MSRAQAEDQPSLRRRDDQRICTPEMAREITSRWISDVPSKIV